jgi:hypothetical protein
MIASIVLLHVLSLARVALGDSAFFMDAQNALTVETLDPIVSPNAYGGHQHRIIGGSGFNAGYDRDAYAGAKCSSMSVQADKSNYWAPREYIVYLCYI